MSTETRDRIAVRMDQETSRRLEQWYLADNCKSKNEFILKAMNFYIDHLEIKDNKSLLPMAIMSAIDGRVASICGCSHYCISRLIESVSLLLMYMVFFVGGHDSLIFLRIIIFTVQCNNSVNVRL